MKKEDLMLLFLVIALILAAIITILFGGERSRHGTGALFPEAGPTLHSKYLVKQRAG